jgi:cytochrome b561
MFRNTDTRYGLVAKFLHWSIAALILGLIWLGWYMVGLTYFDKWYNESLSLHKACGLLVLGLALLKLGWLAYSPSPAFPPGLARWEQIAARSVHHILILMMVLIPVTGYLISTSAGKPVSFFGLLDVPAVVPVGERLRDLAIDAHFYLAYGTGVLAAGHVLAACKHQFLDRNGTLARMLWG